MFLYDWGKILGTAKNSPTEIFRIFKMLVLNEVPKNKYDPIYRYHSKSFIGSSFLVHPDVLVYYAYKHSYLEISQYLALASLRSYAKYLIDGDTRLWLPECPVDLNQIEKNSLFEISDTHLHFIYEEPPTKEEKQLWH